VADFALQLLAQLGVSPPLRTPHLQLTAEELALVHPFFVKYHLDPQHDRLVVLHPGSGSASKRWPMAQVAMVIEALAEQAHVKPVIITGYAEATLMAEMRSIFCRRTPLLAENWPLIPTAALMAHAAVFIGNDSGLTHLASVLGRPTVAIFGPTDPALWGPRGEHVTIVQVKGGAESGWPVSGSAVAPHAQTPDVVSVLQAVQHWLARASPRRSRDGQAERS
jgi:ADP-heptose:LPS heptosyltransferase